MDGDVAPLGDIAALARAHDACLIVDDAHAIGILGEGGAGLSGEADIVIGTFSKALGAFGGFVASSETVRDYLINRCAGVIYATALPPPVLGAIDAALEIVPGMDAERAHVASLAERFRAGAGAAELNTGASTTQIVPIVVGTPEAALTMSGRLRQAGLWASTIRPPTVPPGTARLRLAFTAAHQESDVDRLLDVLAAERAPRRARAIKRQVHFVLVHGWGFHAGIWTDFIGHLGGAEIHLGRSRLRLRRPQGRTRLAVQFHRHRPFAWAPVAALPRGRALPGLGQHPGFRLFLAMSRRRGSLR